MENVAPGDLRAGFPRLLASLRIAAGLTQEELAERADLTPRAVSGMERGQVRRPQRRTVERLVKALELTGPGAEHFVAIARGHRTTASGHPAQVQPAGGQAPGPVGAEQKPGPTGLGPPAQLPSAIRPFRGRAEQVEALDAALAATLVPGGGPGICLLTGPTGVGKTALAVHWAHRVGGRFPDGHLFLDLRGHGGQHPIDPADALAVLLRSLGLDDATMAVGVAERSGQLRSVLARRRVIMVLDDARSIEQVRPLLPGSGNSFCLITSQDRLPGLVARDGGTALPLDLFDLDEAASLLADLIPRQLLGEDDERSVEPTLRRIAELCARLPLALRIAAERITTHPEVPVRAHARQLEQAGPLDALHTGGDDRTAIRTVLAWSVDRLDPATRAAFVQLGAHPGREWDTSAAAVLIGTTRARAIALLEELARAHLVQQLGADRWRQHDLLRAFAAERAAADPARRRAGVAALSEHYLACTGAALDRLLPAERTLRPTPRDASAWPGPPWEPSDSPEQTWAGARDWLQREGTNAVALIRQAHEDGLHEATVRLAVMWRRPLELGGASGDGVEAFRCAHASALQLAGRTGEADCLRALASFHYLRDEHADSADLFARALDVARALPDPARICRALSGLGGAEMRLGQFSGAEAHLREALEVAVRSGDATAIAVKVNLANLEYLRGDFEQAADWAGQALQEFSHSGSVHGEMHARQLLADIQLAGRSATSAESALEQYRRVWRLAEELGDASMLAKAVVGTDRALALLPDSYAGLEELRDRTTTLLSDLGLDDETARQRVAAR